MSQTYDDSTIAQINQARAKFAELWEQAASRYKVDLAIQADCETQDVPKFAVQKEDHAA